MAGMDKLQPSPKPPLPEPESYESDSAGPNPPLPGVVAIGIVVEPVPVTGLAANFSPIPRMAPPPLGMLMAGADTLNVSFSALVLSLVPPRGMLSIHSTLRVKTCTVGLSFSAYERRYF